MKEKQNKFQKVMEQYVLDCLDFENCDKNIDSMTDKEKVETFFEVFDEEFNYAYNKAKYKALDARIEQYIKGLPSVCGVLYDNYQTGESLKANFGIKNDIILGVKIGCWFNYVANALIRLATKNNVPIEKYL